MLGHALETECAAPPSYFRAFGGQYLSASFHIAAVSAPRVDKASPCQVIVKEGGQEKLSSIYGWCTERL